MRKLILSTLALLAFSIAIAVFQISCTKTANSQSPSYTLMPATTSKLGGVIPDGTTISVDGNGKISTIAGTTPQEGKLLYGVFGNIETDNAMWTSNYDGTNAQKIAVALPAGTVIDPDDLRLSPDHKTIFFEAHTIPPAAISYYLYSCNIDGSNPHQIKGPFTNGVNVEVAY